MTTRPHTVIYLAMTPDDLPMRTFRQLLKMTPMSSSDEVAIHGKTYAAKVMQNDYDESTNIHVTQGDIVLYRRLRKGIEFSQLVTEHNELDSFAKRVCPVLQCEYKICLTADYF